MTDSDSTSSASANLDDCSLPVSVQRRNIVCFVSYWCVFYFCAPVTYIGTTHANLLKSLGNSDAICNLPSAMYLWLTVVPVVIAWTLSHPRYLKRLILIPVSLMSLMTAGVAILLWIDASATVRTCAIVIHGAIFGMCSGVLMSSLWDSLRRGVSTSRRGVALGFTFGCGPIFACFGALIQDSLFNGQMTGGRTFGLNFPHDFGTLFAVMAPLLFGAGLVMSIFAVPPESLVEPVSKTTFKDITEGLAQFVRNRIVWYTILIYVLVYSGGNTIISNVSLHAQTVLQNQTGTLGLQNVLRFGCKAIAGAMLGWLLARTTPRATLFATTSILLMGMIWALNTTGWMFMATFGLLGMGELFGAYFPNYVTTASEKKFVRLNMSYLGFLSVLIGFSSIGFGLISDKYGRIASFYVSASMLTLAMLMICFLPANPALLVADSEKQHSE